MLAIASLEEISIPWYANLNAGSGQETGGGKEEGEPDEPLLEPEKKSGKRTKYTCIKWQQRRAVLV